MKRTLKFKVDTKETSFGKIFDFEIPEDADVIILCVNYGTGLKPFNLCLPHQAYIKKAAKLLFDKDPRPFEITAIPIRSDEYIDLCEGKISLS